MYQGRIVFNKIFCFSVVLLTLWSAPVLGAELFVPSSYPTIQAAVEVARPQDGDVVVVLDGIHSGEGNVNLLINKPITIRSQNGKENCTIDCGGSSRAFTFSGPDTDGAVLSGFTIRGGNGQGLGDWPGFGGAILFQNNASATISDCTLSSNTADFGGAIACIQSSPVITRCILDGNRASSAGGGLLCYDSSSPTVIRCTVGNNQAYLGGGVYLDTKASPTIYDCLIARNSATLGGGGICCFSMCSPSLRYCTLSGNIVSGDDFGGGGIFSYYECSSHITNSILWGNEATNGPEIYLYTSTVAIDHSDVSRGEQDSNIYIDASEVQWGDGNIDQDPLFVGAGDYHLSPDSPCIDAGNDADASPAVATLAQDEDPFDYDIEGDPRIIGGAPDMGADEFAPEDDDVLQVEIDIKPDKQINLKSWGLLLVAAKSTDGFDAATIDPSTVLFAGAKPLLKMLIDVDRNRKKDMLFVFWIPQLDLDEDSTEATLTGQTKDKKSFQGTDTVTILKPKVKEKEKGEKKSKEKDKEKGCSSKKK